MGREPKYGEKLWSKEYEKLVYIMKQAILSRKFLLQMYVCVN